MCVHAHHVCLLASVHMCMHLCVRVCLDLRVGCEYSIFVCMCECECKCVNLCV